MEHRGTHCAERCGPWRRGSARDRSPWPALAGTRSPRCELRDTCRPGETWNVIRRPADFRGPSARTTGRLRWARSCKQNIKGGERRYGSAAKPRPGQPADRVSLQTSPHRASAGRMKRVEEIVFGAQNENWSPTTSGDGLTAKKDPGRRGREAGCPWHFVVRRSATRGVPSLACRSTESAAPFPTATGRIEGSRKIRRRLDSRARSVPGVSGTQQRGTSQDTIDSPDRRDPPHTGRRRRVGRDYFGADPTPQTHRNWLASRQPKLVHRRAWQKLIERARNAQGPGEPHGRARASRLANVLGPKRCCLCGPADGPQSAGRSGGMAKLVFFHCPEIAACDTPPGFQPSPTAVQCSTSAVSCGADRRLCSG